MERGSIWRRFTTIPLVERGSLPVSIFRPESFSYGIAQGCRAIVEHLLIE